VFKVGLMEGLYQLYIIQKTKRERWGEEKMEMGVGERREKTLAARVSRQCPLVLLVNVGG